MRVASTGSQCSKHESVAVLLLLMLLAVCRARQTAAAVTEDMALKLAGHDPGIPSDVEHKDVEYKNIEYKDIEYKLPSSTDSSVRADTASSKVSEGISEDFRYEEDTIEVIDPYRRSDNSVEKPVPQIHRLISSGVRVSKRTDKLNPIFLRKEKMKAKLDSEATIASRSSRASKNISSPGASIYPGASNPALGLASNNEEDAAERTEATLLNFNTGLSSPEKNSGQPRVRVPRLPVGVSRNVLDSTSGDEIPPLSLLPYNDVPSSMSEHATGHGKHASSVLKSSVFARNTAGKSTFKNTQNNLLTIKSNPSHYTNTSDLLPSRPLLSASNTSASFSDSNIEVPFKNDGAIEGLPNDHNGHHYAEGKSNIVKRSASSGSGIHDTDSDLQADEGPTGHVMHRGIMENFAGDFMRNPVDLEFSDDYFNHEPYLYDIYYDDSMNNDFPANENLGVEEIERPESLPDKSGQTYPWEDDVGPNDATEDVEENFEDVENTLELRLLGPDFQSELGYVLGRLANDSQQRNRRHQMPVRHHDPRYSEGISVGVTEGTCPPPVHSLPPGLCQAPPCTSHMMCYPQKMCCFNGCTYTCTEPVQPPPVVDWLEDTDIRLPILDPLNPALPLRFESSPLSYGTGGGETVRLPGGCSLSATKYEELKQFMTADSIQDCLCSGGEVVCVVKSSPSK